MTVETYKAPGQAGIDVSAVEALGYTVETNSDGTDFPYTLIGKRGARYGLMRNVPRPSMLFAVNARSFVMSALPGGYTWFSDDDDVLRPV